SASGESRVARFESRQEVIEPRESSINDLTGIDDHESLTDVGVKNRRVLNHVVDSSPVIAGLKSQSARQLIVHAHCVLVLFVGFQARGDALFRGCASGTRRREGAEVLVFQEG